ncbi:MAG: S8 family serine peptidase, partial [Candidatus Methylomirabilis sp.]|nr:S8 family serine peptidase [Deltaproteobacteria bacterium]
ACVIDSGIDASVPELAGRIAATYCFCDDNPVPGFGCCDGGAEEGVGAAEPAGMDHGTSVAAIVASGHVQERGVAPGGKIVAVKVFGPSGYAYRSDVQKALEFCDANRALYDIKVVNLSLGSGKYASDCPSDSRTQAVASLVAHGVSVVAASGNDGYMDGVNAPACIPGIVSVGAVYDALIGPVTWCFNSSCTSKCKDSVANTDGINCYSNAGPNLDVLAPGYASTVVRKGGAYRNMGGTSAAAPHVSGAMLALAQARPEWTPAERFQALQSTGKSVMDLRAGLAFPRVDLYAALGLEDADGDGVKAPSDNCPQVFNPDQTDSDADGRGDPCDNCPSTPNFGQEDVNGNGAGDVCEEISPSCLPPADAADAASAAGPREAGFHWDLFGLALIGAAVMARRLRARP